jgi:hypothetical protein
MSLLVRLIRVPALNQSAGLRGETVTSALKSVVERTDFDGIAC